MQIRPDGICTICKASPIMNTMSESVISSGLLIKYPATTTRSTACAWMNVLDEIRTMVAVGNVVVVKTKSGLGTKGLGRVLSSMWGKQLLRSEPPPPPPTSPTQIGRNSCEGRTVTLLNIAALSESWSRQASTRSDMSNTISDASRPSSHRPISPMTPIACSSPT